MSSSKLHPAIELTLPATLPPSLGLRRAAPTLRAGEPDASSTDALQAEVLQLFDACAPRLRRYVASFGLDGPTTEDVVQEVFLALFRHLRLGRSRRNLPGWLFQVGHHLALKQRYKIARRQRTEGGWDPTRDAAVVDPAANPEEALAATERRRSLRAVVRALPERDRRCLYLRAEGLRYRDIARTLEISLGSVAKSLARALARLASMEHTQDSR